MPRYQQADWYALPRYYDIVYGPDTPTEADFIDALYHQYLSGGHKRILEPACGSGRLLLALAQRGYEVAGFDLSQPMLEFAQRELARHHISAPLWQDRLESFQCRQHFDLAHCLVSSFKYLLDEAAAKAHLQRVAQALRPGGVYLLGLHLTEYDQLRRQRERWVGRRDGITVINNLQAWPPDWQTRREAMRSRLIVQRGQRVERYETHWQFRTYDTVQLRRLLKSTPALTHIATYNFDYDSTRPTSLDDDRLDKVLVLQRQGRRGEDAAAKR